MNPWPPALGGNTCLLFEAIQVCLGLRLGGTLGPSTCTAVGGGAAFPSATYDLSPHRGPRALQPREEAEAGTWRIAPGGLLRKDVASASPDDPSGQLVGVSGSPQPRG